MQGWADIQLKKIKYIQLQMNILTYTLCIDEISMRSMRIHRKKTRDSPKIQTLDGTGTFFVGPHNQIRFERKLFATVIANRLGNHPHTKKSRSNKKLVSVDRTLGQATFCAVETPANLLHCTAYCLYKLLYGSTLDTTSIPSSSLGRASCPFASPCGAARQGCIKPRPHTRI